MSNIRFVGRVTPPTFNITFPFAMAAQWKDDDVDYSVNMRITIKENVVTAECELDNYERTTHIARLLIRATDTAQTAIDLVAFSLGAPLTVTFETFSESDGNIQPLRFMDQDLAALVTAFTLDTPEFHQVLQLVMEEQNLYLALRDLIDATSAPYKVVPHCAKAIETLRTLLTPSGAGREQGWQVMRSSLRVDKAYLKLITDQSTAPRHGDHQAVPATVTEEVSKRAWTVMNRFLEFRKRGNHPLPLEHFPLLTG